MLTLAAGILPAQTVPRGETFGAPPGFVPKECCRDPDPCVHRPMPPGGWSNLIGNPDQVPQGTHLTAHETAGAADANGGQAFVPGESLPPAPAAEGAIAFPELGSAGDQPQPLFSEPEGGLLSRVPMLTHRGFPSVFSEVPYKIPLLPPLIDPADPPLIDPDAPFFLRNRPAIVDRILARLDVADPHDENSPPVHSRTRPPEFPIPQGGWNTGRSPTINVTGQVQIDNITFSQGAESKQEIGDFQNATGFRRARLGTFGEIYQTVEYRIEFDFASTGRPRFLDNWVAIQDVGGLPNFGNVIIGHFFEPFSLERYTPNRFITFLERSATDELAPARNTGIMLYDHTQDMRTTWAFGVFRSDSNEYGDAVNDSADFAGTAHITWLAWYEDLPDPNEISGARRLLHLGASYSYRAAGDKEVRFRRRAEARLQAFSDVGSPLLADTGPIPADSWQLFGLEAAWVHGPFSMQSEYIYTHVDRIGGANPGFHAWYVYGSYFLTGEHRSYSPTGILGRFREGIFQRISPNTNAFKGRGYPGAPRGIGAWEIAARWDSINLDSHDIFGGRVDSLTIGMNWYINANTRAQFNWVRPFVRNGSREAVTMDMIGVRMGLEF